MKKTRHKHGSVAFGDGFDELVAKLIESGRFNTRSEVVRAGLRLLEQAEASRPAEPGLKPFTKEEAKRAFAPDRQWDALESHIVKQSKHRPPEPD